MKVKQGLFRLYWTTRRVIAPELRYAQDAYEKHLCQAVTPQTRWLDIGCGHQVLGDWRLAVEQELVSRAAQVVGLDPDADAVSKHRTITDIRVGSAESLPFPDESYDLVTANMVVEHLSDPAAVFREIHRVLAPGGVFLFHTPNLRSYAVALPRMLPLWMKKLAARILEGRSEDDVYPTYYRLNSERAIVDAAAASGLEIGAVDFIASDAVFALILPLAIPELMWIRVTMREGMKAHRTNLIAVLRKSSCRQ